MYREILFLAIVALGREKISYGKSANLNRVERRRFAT